MFSKKERVHNQSAEVKTIRPLTEEQPSVAVETPEAGWELVCSKKTSRKSPAKTARPPETSAQAQRAAAVNTGKHRRKPSLINTAYSRQRFYAAAPAIEPIDPLEEIRQLASELETAERLPALEERINNLGCVSLDAESYFPQTRDSKNCVKEFFKFLVRRKEILEAIEAGLRDKQINLAQDKDDVWPGCISFVTGTLGDKNVCFVAVSRAANGNDTGLLALLDELAQDLNHGQKVRGGKYYYAVAMETSKKFKTMIYHLTGQTRTCAEYDFGSVLSKLYVEYGKELKVEGCVNAFLFNYTQNRAVEYKKDMRGRTLSRVTVSEGYDSPVKKRKGNVELTIEPGQNVTLIPCCSICQRNKYNFLATLINFQEEGEKFRQIQRETAILSEQISTSEKKSNRLSTGVNGLTGMSMNGFLTSLNQCSTRQNEDEASVPIMGIKV